MAKEDEDKTLFFTGERVYCYQKMPFGLKNTGATYQRLVDKVFNDQIGRNLKAYVDDMVIKSTSEEDLMADIKETFQSNKETPKDFLIKAPLEDNKKDVERKTDMKLEETKLICECKLYTDGASSSDGSGARVRSIVSGSTNSARNGNRKLSNICKLSTIGKSSKGNLRSQTTNHQRVSTKNKGNLKKVQELHNRAHRRKQNKKANALSKLALMTFEHLTNEILVEVLARRSIEEKEVLQVETNEEESWMTPIHEYLLSVLLPEDPKESRNIIIKAP
nr:reverse transcriptase domain-containing protein [Tanacetum cinerariifolium]